MNNLEEMNKCPEIQNFPRLNQEEIENINRAIINIELVIKILTSNESPGPDNVTGELYQIFSEELTHISQTALKK